MRRLTAPGRVNAPRQTTDFLVAPFALDLTNVDGTNS
jgi:hypothetical protein